MFTMFLIFPNLIIFLLSIPSDAALQLNPDRLDQITSIALCYHLVGAEISYCIDRAEEKSKEYLKGINPESEFYTKVVCCGNWKLRNCWINAAKGKCNSSDIEQLSKIIYTRHPNLDEECWQYPDDLSNCGYPKYVVVIISLIVIVAVVAIVVGLIVFYYRWQRRVSSVDIHKPSYLNNDEIRDVEIKVGTEV